MRLVRDSSDLIPDHSLASKEDQQFAFKLIDTK